MNGELYGPLMLVLTLIAILLFSMKSSGHTVVSQINHQSAGLCFQTMVIDDKEKKEYFIHIFHMICFQF